MEHVPRKPPNLPRRPPEVVAPAGPMLNYEQPRRRVNAIKRMYHLARFHYAEPLGTILTILVIVLYFALRFFWRVMARHD
jgi:hypothetical protein